MIAESTRMAHLEERVRLIELDWAKFKGSLTVIIIVVNVVSTVAGGILTALILQLLKHP